MGVRGLESRPWLQSYSLRPGRVAGACMDEDQEGWHEPAWMRQLVEQTRE